MRLVGRIMLIVVGILLILAGVGQLLTFARGLFTAEFWQNILDGGLGSKLIKVITALMQLFAGLVALLAGIFNRRSLALIIIAIVLFVWAILYLIGAITAHQFGDFGQIISVVGTLTLPVVYFLGAWFMRKKR